jgi:hypothetical protein
MTAADRIEQLRNENDRLQRVNEHLRERLERELKRNAERKDRTMSIRRDEIRIGAAHAENRAPSHDGEYLSVYYAAVGGDYIIEGNAGVVATSQNIDEVIADAVDASVRATGNGDVLDEMCRWRTEAEAIVNTGSGDDWNAERMGLEARAAAAELGWL